MLELFYLVFTAVLTSVPTAFSAAIVVIFFSFDMMRITLKQKIKKNTSLLFSFPPAALTLSIYSRRVQNKILTHICYLILAALGSRAWDENKYIGQNSQEKTCAGVSIKLQTLEIGKVNLKESAINVGSSKTVSPYKGSKKKAGWMYWILFISI